MSGKAITRGDQPVLAVAEALDSEPDKPETWIRRVQRVVLRPSSQEKDSPARVSGIKPA
jgi:hypothetical protein